MLAKRGVFIMKLVVTVSEVASLLSISLNHAYAMAKSGQLPTIRLGRRIMVPVDALNQMLSQCKGAAKRAEEPLQLN